MKNYLISEAIGDIAGSAYEGNSQKTNGTIRIRLNPSDHSSFLSDRNDISAGI
jgi:hypothetical protein